MRSIHVSTLYFPSYTCTCVHCSCPDVVCMLSLVVSMDTTGHGTYMAVRNGTMLFDEIEWKHFFCLQHMYMYHYTKIIVVRASVCTSGRWPEAIRPELKCFISRHRWTWGDTTDSPLTRLGMAQAASNELLKNNSREKLDWTVLLTMAACGM